MNTFEKVTEIFNSNTSNFSDITNVESDGDYLRFTAVWYSNPILNSNIFEMLSDFFKTEDFFVDELIDHGSFKDLDFHFYGIAQDTVKDFVNSHYHSIVNA